MSRTVLVPVDGSEPATRALRHALREFPDATITAYHVVDLFEPVHADLESVHEPMIGSDAWYAAASDATDHLFDEVEGIADDYDRSVATESDIGDPKRLIVEYAADEGVDHVVIGAHGRSGEDRALFGTVAETVVRRVSVPVTVVR